MRITGRFFAGKIPECYEINLGIKIYYQRKFREKILLASILLGTLLIALMIFSFYKDQSPKATEYQFKKMIERDAYFRHPKY